ncbi:MULTISPECIES: MnhB domain-containing protein [Corallococcus]|uniref:MnhB domain-containing protein n=1 Tax=Corallococcus TaxID=83461 RepID=UPI00117FBA63|nr:MULTISPECIES: MnhB domain-containing protein [Corallococcus]NBD12748.1 sodium:proton antiporter [Corallococcus silvisoli]TSC23174.1 sodium:proton antiporter [Corallococcus sp. Z5C101001]
MRSFVPPLSRLLLWPSLMIALAFWLKGGASVGGGFPAGALAGLAVLLQYVVTGREQARRYAAVRYAAPLAGVGLLLVVGTAFLPVLAGYTPMTLFPRPGEPEVGMGGLHLHTALVFEGGLMLIVFGLVVTVIDRFALSTGRGEETGP